MFVFDFSKTSKIEADVNNPYKMKKLKMFSNSFMDIRKHFFGERIFL
jgi:hypothetical protein